MSITYDGTGDYIAVPNISALGFGTGSFGMAFWCYSTSTATQDIFNKNRATATATTAGYGFTISSTASVGFSAHLGDGTNYARINTGTNSNRAGSVWFHAVVNYDRSGNNCYIYFNDSLVNSGSTSAVTGSVSNTTQMCIASNSTPGRYFVGSLTDFCIVNRLITSVERTLLYKSRIKRMPIVLFGSSLVGYYPMDYTANAATVSTTTGAMLDLSASVNHSTCKGNPVGLAENILTYN